MLKVERIRTPDGHDISSILYARSSHDEKSSSPPKYEYRSPKQLVKIPRPKVTKKNSGSLEFHRGRS
jgi:hypothetical protein